MIEPGQTYRQCHPQGGRTARILIRKVGPTQAEVAHLDTGRRGLVIDAVSLNQLHDSPTTRDGRPRRTGYALEKP